jgi:hypothetical protein
MFTSVKRTFSKFNPFAQAEAAAYFEKDSEGAYVLYYTLQEEYEYRYC